MIPQSNDTFTVRQAGAYRNLPTYPSVSGLTAIVPGATGISGWNTIRALLDSPTRWTKIYAVSRSPPSEGLTDLLSREQQSRIQHLHVDFSGSPQDIAKALAPVHESDPYVFFYAYMQPKTEAYEAVWSNVEKLEEVNGRLLASFLQALELANIVPKRVLLQTGGKNYGVQLGRAPQPCVESDPQPRHLGSNFYYPQEDSLTDYCKRHPKTSWNVIRPFGVIGSAIKAQMSGLYLFCVYAAVQAHKKEPLYFPGDWATWQGPTPMSTARLTGYLSEWAVLHDGCGNQAYNSIDSNSMTHERFLAELARWYGNEKGAVGPPDDTSKFQKAELKGGKQSPLGYGPPLVSGSSFKILDWARKKCNKTAWKEIMEASGGAITTNPFEEDVVKENFQLLDIYFSIVATASMNKARRQGWTGFADTLEAAFESAQELVGMGLLPPLVAESAKPLI
jgi:nucleoside-diphosphate-sugar epimerase